MILRFVKTSMSRYTRKACSNLLALGKERLKLGSDFVDRDRLLSASECIQNSDV